MKLSTPEQMPALAADAIAAAELAGKTAEAAYAAATSPAAAAAPVAARHDAWEVASTAACFAAQAWRYAKKASRAADAAAHNAACAAEEPLLLVLANRNARASLDYHSQRAVRLAAKFLRKAYDEHVLLAALGDWPEGLYSTSVLATLPRLETLILTDVLPQAATQVLQAPLMQLKVLHIKFDFDTQIAAAECLPLCLQLFLTPLPALESLAIDGRFMLDKKCAYELARGRWPQLKGLSFLGWDIGLRPASAAAALLALGNACWAPHIERLDFLECALGPVAVAAVCRGRWTQLQSLNWRDNREFDNAALKELLAAPWIDNLVDVNLDNNSISPAGVTLLRGVEWRSLQRFTMLHQASPIPLNGVLDENQVVQRELHVRHPGVFSFSFVFEFDDGDNGDPWTSDEDDEQ
jgi:hypothetical protein